MLNSITLTGLYFKLHGTHRPNSMKKTVIKRRKRVSAAGVGGNVSGRMSDQAAAEALVAVGRLGVSPGEADNDESDGEADQPRKKRTRRTVKPRGSGVDKDHDVVMDGEDDEDTREQTQRDTRKRRGVNGWTEGGRSSSPQHRAPSRNQDYSRTGGGGGSGGLPTFPGSGFELPPLAALNNGAAFLGNASAPPSSYIRSGSNAPSRTHSPLGPAGSGSGAGYVLPPPHGLGYYPSTPPADMSSLMVAAGVALGGLGIPSYMDLERHYFELSEQKRKWEEMMERTDRLMAGVKRTLDEMRGLVAQQSTPPPPPQPIQQQPQQSSSVAAVASSSSSPASTQQPQAATASSSPQLQPTEGAATAAAVPAVPLNRGGSSGERERDASIWPVIDVTPVHD